MYKLVYMGGYNPRIFEKVLEFEKIKLVGFIIDYTLSQNDIEETKLYLKKSVIPEIQLNDVDRLKPDMIFLCGYTKILKSELIEKYLFVNIHAGILPKWRGFNANCWAMLNGENHIGYTIHRVREGLDAGEIYKIIDIELDRKETYASGRERIKNILCDRLEEIFEEILSGEIQGVLQDENGIVYNCRLRKTDGDIHDWKRSATYIYGLYRVFGVKPDGTGVRMYVKGKAYTILNMEQAEEIACSEGVPGAVINKYMDGSVLIKTSDTAVRVIELEDEEGNKLKPGSVLRIGMRL